MENPFGAPVFHIRETTSTMQTARELAEAGEKSGTVIYADFQSGGRARIDGRVWISPPRENLLCTILLRMPPVSGFTLRIGLAVALTFDAFLPTGRKTRIKWPNDVLFEGKKLAGILCENDGSVVYAGTGLNIAWTSFPPGLSEKATSLALIMANLKNGETTIAVPFPEEVLAVYLVHLQKVLADDDWHTRISEKLFRKGETVRFLSGDPGKNGLIDGVLEGIGSSGELLVRPDGKQPLAETDANGLLHLFSGEIPY
jgi:BirA family biotin operon repressor/biotin-[acetyl-CoA-carboxylase] ligase